MRVQTRNVTLAEIVRRECANFTRGGCLWGHRCYILDRRPCRYFEQSVAPGWPSVLRQYQEIAAQGRLIEVDTP